MSLIDEPNSGATLWNYLLQWPLYKKSYPPYDKIAVPGDRDGDKTFWSDPFGEFI
jgi:hypothetical protein